MLRRNFLVKLSANGDAVPSRETDSVENKAIEAEKGDPFGHFRGVISSLPPVVFVVSLILMTFLSLPELKGKKATIFSVALVIVQILVAFMSSCSFDPACKVC